MRSINLNSITFIIIIIGRTHGNSMDYLQGLNSQNCIVALYFKKPVRSKIVEIFNLTPFRTIGMLRKVEFENYGYALA